MPLIKDVIKQLFPVKLITLINNGSLYLVKKLTAGMTFNITVIAIDQENHSLYDQTNVEILSYDDESCLPTFRRTFYIFNTTEHRITPYKIGNESYNTIFIVDYSSVASIVRHKP